ncbi:MAG: hypothetical protein CMJ46_11670 [Planctomyces sp.]|nr:hypothetical protein [Planctomyces sp.]
MELYDALNQISAIRHQIAKSEVFRGYRSATVAVSGGFGIVAAMIQPSFAPAPAEDLLRYLLLWFLVAAVSLILVGIELFHRAFRSGSGLVKQMTISAVGQFLPCLVVGAMLTTCILFAARESGWMLPGLWSLLFALGIFSSFRMLPAPVCWAGAWYVLCGCGCLLWGQGEYAFSPWQMGITFGGGQLLSAGLLYWNLERHDGS